jgi:hypothetical protein
MHVGSSVQFFYLIYVPILFNGVDDVMPRNSRGLTIRGLSRMENLHTNMLDQECLMYGNVRFRIINHFFSQQ